MIDTTQDMKRELRRQRWAALRAAGAARFPGAAGRVPNFTGAEAAAEVLAGQRAWHRARVVKANPDLAQRPVRHRALREGKTVIVPVPRLMERRPFLVLDPAKLDPRDLWQASCIAGALALATSDATPGRLPPIDLVVLGCVAVAPDGARLGRGGGFADLEYALLREHDALGPRTPIVTTVHPTQVLAAGTIPMRPHDVPVSLYCTPTDAVACARTHRRPRGILWDRLAPDRRQEVPALARRPRRGG